MANAARGEVDLKAGGKTFTLCAELARVAAWCHDLKIESLIEMQRRVYNADPMVLLSGVKQLCVSDNADELIGALHFRDYPAVQGALTKALVFGLDAPGNADAAGA